MARVIFPIPLWDALLYTWWPGYYSLYHSGTHSSIHGGQGNIPYTTLGRTPLYMVARVIFPIPPWDALLYTWWPGYYSLYHSGTHSSIHGGQGIIPYTTLGRTPLYMVARVLFPIPLWDALLYTWWPGYYSLYHSGTHSSIHGGQGNIPYTTLGRTPLYMVARVIFPTPLWDALLYTWWPG